MRSPALALGWHIWRGGRVTVATLVSSSLTLVLLIHLLPALFREPELADQLPALFLFMAAMLGVAASLWLQPERPGLDRLPWQLTLPLRTEALVGWPLLFAVAATGLGWGLWRVLVVLPTGRECPVWWPGFCGAAVTAWIQVWAQPPMIRGRRLLHFAAATVLVGLGASLLIDPPELGLAALVPARGSGGIAEVVLSTLYAALILAAYRRGVIDLARARRGDLPVVRELRSLDVPWVARWLSPQRSRPFASPQAAQFWFEWHEHGLALPACWVLLQVVALCLGLIGVVAVWVFHAPDDLEHLVAQAWWHGPLLFTYFVTGLGGMLLSVNIRHQDTDQLRFAVAPASFGLLRPLATGEIVLARLTVASLSILITWILMVGEAGLLFAFTDGTTTLHAELGHFVRDHRSIPDIGWLSILAGALLLWLWKQPVETLYFGLSGRRWLLVSGWALHVVLAFGTWLCLLYALTHADEVREVLWNPPGWLIASTAGVVALKFLLATAAMARILQRRLLRPRRLGGLLIGWLTLCGGLAGCLVGLLPAGLVPWPWLVAGVVLLLPLARVAAAPCILAASRHGS